MTTSNYRPLAKTLFQKRQDEICAGLLEFESNATEFHEDIWERPDEGATHGGGGRTRVFSDGEVFEKAGVNFSEVHGTLPLSLSEKLTGVGSPADFYATGISLVIHPLSPLVPTTHANFRYLEVGERKWFGGGIDLTPYYVFPEDCKHFHSTLKEACDKHDLSFYPKFKEWCDKYFYLPHRGETRGIGGLFYDYLGKEDEENLQKYFDFSETISAAFLPSYLPIVKERAALSYGEKERHFQLVRRGRYVEFNLLYDRGTQFGLETGGRTESILMSLPPLVQWVYDFNPLPGSREAEIYDVVKSPRSWV